MSDLDEPPAKILKIDNINGVTHVTELDNFPVPFDGAIEDEIMGEESGIIEGGADPEGQEEWLSEGILTDDDYNPVSQETINDRTDSNLDSSREDHLDSTFDSEAHLGENEEEFAENEAEFAENETHSAKSEVHLKNEAHLAESEVHLENEADLAESEDDLENEAEFAGNKTHLAESEVHLENEAHLEESEVHLENEAHLEESEEHLENEADLAGNSFVESEPNDMEIDRNASLENENIAQDESYMSSEENEATSEVANIAQKEVNVTANVEKLMESQTYTEEYPANIEANTVSGIASDIVIQRVVTLIKNPIEQETESRRVELNIEQTMQNLEGEADVKSDGFDSLLKKDTAEKTESKLKVELKEDYDNGNDTDDLLRMLEEDDSKGKKKLSKTVKDKRVPARDAASTDDDDDFVYQGVGIKSLKQAQSALARKQLALKAEPEDADDGDDEHELLAKETKTVQKILGLKSSQQHNEQMREKPKQAQNMRLSQPLLKSTKPSATQKSYDKKTPVTKTTLLNRTIFVPADVKAPAPFKSTFIQNTNSKTLNAKTIETQKSKTESGIRKAELGIKKTVTGRLNELGKIKIEPETIKVAAEDIIHGEEYLDDEDYGLDEDEFADSDNDISHHRQRVMRLDTMDNDMPTDDEGASDDASLYDEMPSSDSDDMEDWFQLDIRSEKAGDYIPLLGPKAKDLLLEEKRRVAARLSTLRQSHTALASSGKQQAALLRRATAALAEIDDMLRAA